MTTAVKCKINCQNFFINKIYKYFTLALFFILPSKIANIFVNLSIVAIIYDIRNLNFSKNEIDTYKIQNLLKVAVSDELLLLPSYTMHWFWNDEFLNTKTFINGIEYSLSNVIKDQELFFKHTRLIINLFIDNLPKSMKYKLGIGKLKNKIVLRHNILSILNY